MALMWGGENCDRADPTGLLWNLRAILEASLSGRTISMNTLSSQAHPVSLPPLQLPRQGMDELYHFLQYLQFKYRTDLESAIESVEEEIDLIDCEEALKSHERIPWEQVKRELA